MKEQFLKLKELSSSWRTTAASTEFETVLTYARSEIASKGPTREELRGVELMAHTLLNLAEPEEISFQFPSPGLNHMPDVMPDREPSKPSRKKKA